MLPLLLSNSTSEEFDSWTTLKLVLDAYTALQGKFHDDCHYDCHCNINRYIIRMAPGVVDVHVLRIITESPATAIACGIDKKDGESQIVVYDLASRTVDVSQLPTDDDVFDVF